MNGLVASAAAAGAAIITCSVWWALKAKKILPTSRMVLMFVAGCCASVAFGHWVVRLFAVTRGMFNQLSPEIASILVAIPGAVAIVCAIFFFWGLGRSNSVGARDEKAAFLLPVAAVLIGGMLGAVGDNIRTGTSQTAVRMSSYLVGNGDR